MEKVLHYVVEDDELARLVLQYLNGGLVLETFLIRAWKNIEAKTNRLVWEAQESFNRDAGDFLKALASSEEAIWIALLRGLDARASISYRWAKELSPFVDYLILFIGMRMPGAGRARRRSALYGEDLDKGLMSGVPGKEPVLRLLVIPEKGAPMKFALVDGGKFDVIQVMLGL